MLARMSSWRGAKGIVVDWLAGQWQWNAKEHLAKIIFCNLCFSICFRLTHCSILKEGTVIVPKVRNALLFFFIIMQHNPSFTMLGPNIVVGYGTILEQVTVNDSC